MEQKFCFMAVSYTHLDVYKRQVLFHLVVKEAHWIGRNLYGGIYLVQYTKKLLLKNNKECLLRNAVGADAEEIHNLFNLTHAQTDFLCTYPDENLFDISQEQKILSEKISSENEIEICAVVNGHIVGTAGICLLYTSRCV